MTRRAASWALVLLLASGITACESAPVAEVREQPPSELVGADVLLAFDAMRPLLGDDPHFLEIRADQSVLSLQVVRTKDGSPLVARNKDGSPIVEGALPELEVVEFRRPLRPKPGETTSPPEKSPVVGSASLGENAYPLGDIDVTKIVAAFPLAKKAVDPSEGRLSGLVVRRFLPFHRAIRARIYVESPRMNGSMDTNGKGVPLRP